MEQKLANVTKFSKHQEVKALLKKQKQFDTDESDYSDNISQDDNNDDSDYVPENPQISTGKSTLHKKHHLKRHHLKRHHLMLDQFPFQNPKASSLLKKETKSQKNMQNQTLEIQKLPVETQKKVVVTMKLQ